MKKQKLSFTPHFLHRWNQYFKDEYSPLTSAYKKVKTSWFKESEKHGVRPENVSSILLNKAIQKYYECSLLSLLLSMSPRPTFWLLGKGCLPSMCRRTVQTALGLPGNSETAISDTWQEWRQTTNPVSIELSSLLTTTLDNRIPKRQCSHRMLD